MASSHDRKHYSEECKKIIRQVVQTCREEKIDGKLKIPLSATNRRAAALTGVSETTVYRVARSSLDRPDKRKTRSDKLVLDDFELAVIRRTVGEIIQSKKAVPTAKRLLEHLKEKINYPGGEHHLRCTLKSLGYSWKRVESNRKLLMERNDVLFLRAQYLRIMKRFRQEGRTIIYTDETFVHAGHSAQKCLQSADIKMSVPFNKGNRFIVVHAGSKDGFVRGADLVFKSKSKSGDYHDDMNSENFQQWLQTKLLPNIPRNSVIVIDNAPYHSVQVDRCPSSNATKGVLKDYLRRHNVSFQESMLKVELLELCKRHKPPPTYVVDQVIKEHGHECIRLPPYHADLNAIELIWANMKGKVAARNLTFNMKDVEGLVKQAFLEISSAEWRSCCEHVQRVEEEYWKQDIAKDEEMSRLVIFVDSGDDSDTGTATEGSNSETDTATDSETDTADEDTSEQGVPE